jgi:hypothetical protein
MTYKGSSLETLWIPDLIQTNIIIIIIRHGSNLDRHVAASSNSLFKGLPSRLHPFGLYFSIIFVILLLFVLVTCRKQFDLCLLGFLAKCIKWCCYIQEYFPHNCILQYRHTIRCNSCILLLVLVLPTLSVAYTTKV